MRNTLLLACICLFSTLAFAQTDSTAYFFIDYMKVKPGHESDYVAAEKGVWKSIHTMRKEKGVIDGWWLFQVASPMGTGTEYDYVTVTRVTGWDAIGKANTSWGDIFGAMPADQASKAQNVSEYRDLVRGEIIQGEVFEAKKDFGKSGFPSCLFVNYMDVPQGGWDNYYAMETTLVKPVLVEEMSHPGGRAGWGLYSRTFPMGADYRYDAITVDFYDNWSDAGSAGSFMESFKKVHPKMTVEEFGKKIESSRILARGEVWMLVDNL